MNIVRKAALAAVALICANEAQAASFITYTITGMADLTVGNRNAQLPLTGRGTYQATYVVPIGTGAIGQPATIEGGEYYGTSSLYTTGAYRSGQIYASARGNVLSLTETGFSIVNGSVVTVSTFNICLSNSTGNAFPTTGALAVDTSCSSADFYFPNFFTSTSGKNGTVTSVTASISDTFTSRYGFTSVTENLTPVVPGVPEPTTWALMLAGFAMTGYALRRRRASVAFA